MSMLRMRSAGRCEPISGGSTMHKVFISYHHGDAYSGDAAYRHQLTLLKADF